MKRNIVISAINLRDGGTLSILNDCLQYLDKYLSEQYDIIALVHDKKLISNTSNVRFLEFPKSIKSYFYRVYYEYIHFNKLSKELNPYLWLSLHDMSPNVSSEIQAVYCHNPSPFYKVNKQELFLDYKFSLFSFFYEYLYRINIKKNNYVIVQQNWLSDEFKKKYDIDTVLVSNPNVDFNVNKCKVSGRNKKDRRIFFYPSFPRVFKNFESICEATKLLSETCHESFEVILTIDGTENKYSKMIVDKYKNLENISFVGLQSRSDVFKLYDLSDCLLFPSKLETWGLPITEFKLFNKPIILADLPYAHETVGEYDKVKFFDPMDVNSLMMNMLSFLNDDMKYDKNETVPNTENSCDSWAKLFENLLRIQ